MTDDEPDPRFPVDGAVVGIDDLSGDVFVYAGGGSATYTRNAWWPGITSHKSVVLESTGVRDRETIQYYLSAARDALIRSLEDV